MKKKILRSALLTTLGTALLFTLLVIALLFSFLTEQAYENMEVNLYQINTSMRREPDPIDFLASLSADGFPLRVTLIDPDGGVLFESDSSSGYMDNHMDRAEIQQAAIDGYGESSRLSLTLNQQSYYAALKLEDGRYLRLSETRDNVLNLLGSILMYIFPVLLLVLIFAAMVAVALTQRIVDPINAINLDNPERNSIYPELRPLLNRMSAQSRSIQEYISTLDARRNEFETITSHMAEGMILMNPRGSILSMNSSACRIFQKKQAEGRSIFEISRDETFTRIFRSALQGRRAEDLLHIGGSWYRLMVNPVFDSGHFTGLVALVLNITDHYLAEQNRREFTANVTHELRTPLTSITGYAEIMKSGIAAREDWQGLVECIYKESSRMIRLVEDILHLSRLDSDAIFAESEHLDLCALCEEIIARFESRAENRGVRIRFSGESASIRAPRQLADEIIANLIDNAIKYNRDDGSVDVSLRRAGSRILLTVRDSGIGIAPEDQERIFERFFRVDKSRSKATGGTGLGLSIVKHAVQRIGGEIRILSTPDVGTEITVEFPAE